jgi:hypothetical protein
MLDTDVGAQRVQLELRQIEVRYTALMDLWNSSRGAWAGLDGIGGLHAPGRWHALGRLQLDLFRGLFSF